MSDRTSPVRPPLTLIANSQEWHSRSLESILGPHGYAVLRAYTGKQAIERALGARPDLIIVDTDLPDRDGYDVCRELRATGAADDATPILMTSPGHASRQKRLDALRAGAWDFIGSALDGEELPLRLDAYLRAKREADRARDVSLLDEITGLYNDRGLTRRARELGSQAFRQREPLACLVLTPLVGTGEGSEVLADDAARHLAHAFRETGRTSDAIGMIGPQEFAVVAQGTDSRGAVRLAERLAEAASLTFAGRSFGVAIGYDAVQNYFDAPIEPQDMLQRAASAMRQSRADIRTGGGLSIRPFDSLH